MCFSISFPFWREILLFCCILWIMHTHNFYSVTYVIIPLPFAHQSNLSISFMEMYLLPIDHVWQWQRTETDRESTVCLHVTLVPFYLLISPRNFLMICNFPWHIGGRHTFWIAGLTEMEGREKCCWCTTVDDLFVLRDSHFCHRGIGGQQH